MWTLPGRRGKPSVVPQIPAGESGMGPRLRGARSTPDRHETDANSRNVAPKWRRTIPRIRAICSDPNSWPPDGLLSVQGRHALRPVESPAQGRHGREGHQNALNLRQDEQMDHLTWL